MKYFEASVEIITEIGNNGKEKKVKEVFLVDAQSVTEAEARVVEDFEQSGMQLDYRVVQVKESKIQTVISAEGE